MICALHEYFPLKYTCNTVHIITGEVIEFTEEK